MSDQTNERRPAGAASEPHVTGEVASSVPARRNWRTLLAPPSPAELLFVFGAGWVAAIVAVVR